MFLFSMLSTSRLIEFRAALVGSCALIAAVMMQPSVAAQLDSVALPGKAHETSGLTPSSRGPRWLWTINDSDNGPELIELSTAGKLGRILAVKGATNIDWEAIASQTIGAKRFLYIGDVGGNSLADRRDFVVYRVEEPKSGSRVQSIEARAIRFRYKDGQNHDCESIYVSPGAQSIFLITKPPSRREVAELYRIVNPDPSRQNIAVPVKVVDLVGMERGAAITDMSVNKTGKLLSLLSDNKCYTFVLTRPFDITSFDPVHPTRIVELDLRQAEGLCYGSSSELYITSESRDNHPAMLIRLRGAN